MIQGERSSKTIRPLSFEQYQRVIKVATQQEAADFWFKDVSYLNVYTGLIERGHILVAEGRIAYVGDQEPRLSMGAEIIELSHGEVLVPGYIEAHAHPFQWYNPYSWGTFLLKQGTTTSINDNMFLMKHLSVEQAIELIDALEKERQHLWLWWSRFDLQTALDGEGEQLSTAALTQWLEHPLVVQGGEFTSWPLHLKGKEDLSYWVYLTHYLAGKRIEGHLPGASANTLNALAASGVSADHEALTAEDVVKRHKLGYYTALRYSSIRPDLPDILKELKGIAGVNLNRLMLTNDGSMPFFIEESGCDSMLDMVMAAGYSPVEAYRMVTLNPATYYGLDQLIGGIAPGRLAHLNILSSLDTPTPRAVFLENRFAVKQGEYMSGFKEQYEQSMPEPLAQFFVTQGYTQENVAKLVHKVSESIQAAREAELGIELVNAVITKPYPITEEELAPDECYLILLDRDGKWSVSTRLKGFATHLKALVSTYTAARHILLIGQDEEALCQALQSVLAGAGGIAYTNQDHELLQITLDLAGGMSSQSMPEVITQAKLFKNAMQQQGYHYEDPIYTILFLTATHLPYIRLTERGIYDIKQQQIIAARKD